MLQTITNTDREEINTNAHVISVHIIKEIFLMTIEFSVKLSGLKDCKINRDCDSTTCYFICGLRVPISNDINLKLFYGKVNIESSQQ